jgi:mannose-6-phosphate isomerase-like protein (cupin superfamily)
MTFEPVELKAPTGLRLDDDGGVEVERPLLRSPEVDGRIVVAFRASTNEEVHGDEWEVHPEGDEVVSVRSGQARVVLREEGGDGDADVVTLTAGTACVVPRGRWHRLEVDGPTELLSITPRLGTRIQARA